MARLISFDENGEAWFDNPSLVLANPRRRRRRSPKRNYDGHSGYTSSRISVAEARRMADPAFIRRPASRPETLGFTLAAPKRKKGRKKMAKRKGRMPAGLRRYWAAHRRGKKATTKRRRRTRRPAFVIKARGRKRVMRGRARGGVVRIRVNPRRRFRHNPGAAAAGGSIRLPFGFTMPAFDSILWIGAGMIGAPMVSRKVQEYVPASMQFQGMPWLIDIASVLVPGMFLRKYVNPRAGNLFMAGGATNLVFKAIKQFAPSMASTIGLSGQPLLGKYTNAGGVRRFPVPQQAASLPAMIGNAPERLNPAGRF